MDFLQKNIWHISIGMLLLGCTSKTVTFETQKFEKNRDESHIEIRIDALRQPKPLCDTVNQEVFRAITSVLATDLEKVPQHNNYDFLVDRFLLQFQAFKNVFPDANTNWEAKVEAVKYFESEKILNIKIDYYTYTGGAHGMGGSSSLIFNKETSKKLHLKDLLKNPDAFQPIAEKKFRTQYHIPMQGNINATGLLFENDQFQLPQNIFFTATGIVLHYNRYEIASYAEGEKQLKFTYEEIADFLTIQ